MRYIIAIQLYIYHKYHISCIYDILSKISIQFSNMYSIYIICVKRYVLDVDNRLGLY